MTRACYEKEFRLRVFFADGTSQVIDFGPFVRTSKVPDVTKYAHRNAFKRFRVVDGNVMWGQFEMIFPVDQLYQGKIPIRSQKTAPVGFVERSKRRSRA